MPSGEVVLIYPPESDPAAVRVELAPGGFGDDCEAPVRTIMSQAAALVRMLRGVRS